eukprot:15474985-Alexandrium_andersonii.AAC.1
MLTSGPSASPFLPRCPSLLCAQPSHLLHPEHEVVTSVATAFPSGMLVGRGCRSVQCPLAQRGADVG